MAIQHQNMNLAANYGGQQPQSVFEVINDPVYVTNYLVAPGSICYFLDRTNMKFYEKTYDGTTSYDLANPVVQNRFSNQPASTGLTKEEVSQMIAEALSQYNPHIPKKERKND